jgi:hypothetical protein
MDIWTRRTFLSTGAATTGGFFLAASSGAASSADTPATPPSVPLPNFPGQEPEVVRAVVGAGHGDFEEVKRLVGRQQTLAKAKWDWGFGDWETALGGAAHVGRPEIAEYLIAQGAEPTIFSAAMLGQLEVVKASVLASPAVARLKGPHGIPLLRHAEAGGSRAKAVVEYLKTLETEAAPPDRTLTAEQLAPWLGAYRAADRPTPIVLSMENNRFTLAHNGRSRGLVHLGSFEFHPAGADKVRVVLSEAGGVKTLTVNDPEPVVVARKEG